MLKLILSIAGLFGGHDGLEPTDRLIPPGYQGNPWGPVANEARRAGALPPIPMTPAMTQWDGWGRKVLRDGDVLFRRGDGRVLMGAFPFSRFIAAASGSYFSHTGIAAIEDGSPFIYDMTKAGVRRQPFSVWVLDNVGPVGVKRPRPEHQAKIPQVLAFCRDTYARQVAFDFDLKIDDNELYCVEMTEKAFRSVGLKLSDPVLLGDMENASRFPICMWAFATFSKLTLDQPVFFPGNPRHGIWSSRDLLTVYDPSRDPKFEPPVGSKVGDPLGWLLADLQRIGDPARPRSKPVAPRTDSKPEASTPSANPSAARAGQSRS
ncbi:YiiX/YebB-like N1pC/P60 family cysteine hydrolase [Isosphaeraceae bacterium EP7]